MKACATSRSTLPGLLLFLTVFALAACSGPAGQGLERYDDANTDKVAGGGKPDVDPLGFGKSIYLRNCATCHQPDGRGVPGVFPPLAGSDFLQGNRPIVLAAALFGLTGPIMVNGQDYDGAMPSLGHLSDRELSAAISYVFDAWGNDLEPVTEAEVAALRARLGQSDRAAGQRHAGATEGELTHLGRPSPIPLAGLRQVAGASGARMPEIEFRTAAKLYFERCASCHGAGRGGSIGRPLTPEITTVKGSDYLKAMMTFGSPTGMPNWGTSGAISDIEIDILADFLRRPPPMLPGFDMADIRASWKVLVHPDDRPSTPRHGRDIGNFFAVALQGPGGIAIIDGDARELLAVIETGDHVEELRVSTTGRYVVAMTRAAEVNLIDLYMDPPARVATVKTGHEARAVDIARYAGTEDSVIAAGTYWPPQLVLVDGATLEPLRRVSTRELPGGMSHPEPRIAAVTASSVHPEFIVQVKETGQALFVDYTDIDDLAIESVSLLPLLDAGGWDASRRYLLTAADLSPGVAVLDAAERKRVAAPRVARTASPGRGSNLDDPQYGPVRASSAVGSASVTLIAADPAGDAAQVWRPVRVLQGMGGGSLYARSHPASRNLWVDAPFNPAPEISQHAAAFDINDFDAGFETLPISRWAGLPPGPGRVVQPEYNAAGDEVWFSVWNGAGEPGAIVVVDDASRALKAVIKHPSLRGPTQKINVHNALDGAY
jgi:nitrite reductase (NO-forming)/hydroxylamine reductase